MNEVRSLRAEERGQQQRDRILQAAQQCFIRHGFHAASMASIAETAGMSCGLIYRYFENKSAIIQAIIERQLQERRQDIASLHVHTDLEQRVQQLFEAWQKGDPQVMSAALFLEMSAEASRDPQIAQAIARSDRVAGEDFIGWLRRLAASQQATPDEQELRVRALALQAFIEGLAVRAVREPQLDACLLARTIDRLLPALLDFSAAACGTGAAPGAAADQ